MQIEPGHKFGIIALPEARVAANMPDELQLAPDLWLTRRLPFPVDEFWQRTLGTLQAERLQEARLFFVSATASINPEVLDGENERLQRRVWLAYWGMLLSGFSRFGTPIRLTGTQQMDRSEVRSVGEIEMPGHTHGTPLQNVDEVRLRLASDIAEALAILLSKPKKERFSRVLHAFYAGITDRDASERLHQFARCIEGFIVPDPGATARQFKSRTELFVGASCQADMGEIYDIRSAVEHLHSPFTPIHRPTERERRLVGLQRAVQTEELARYCIRSFLLNSALWSHFDNDAASLAFWKLPAADRQNLWGPIMDFGAVKRSFDDRFIEDHDLGL